METNLKLAQFIAHDEGEKEILLPVFGWYWKENHVPGNRPEYSSKRLSDMKFDTDWNWIMLVGKAILDDLQKEKYVDMRHRGDKLSRVLGLCDEELAYNTICEYVDDLNNFSNRT